MSSSFGEKKRSASKPRTLAATSLRSLSVGKSVMLQMPLSPASRRLQNVGTSLPAGLTTPMPVIATRRRPAVMRALRADALLDLGHEIAHGDELDQVFVRDHDAELRLHLADDLHHRERVDAELGDDALARDFRKLPLVHAGGDGLEQLQQV